MLSETWHNDDSETSLKFLHCTARLYRQRQSFGENIRLIPLAFPSLRRIPLWITTPLQHLTGNITKRFSTSYSNWKSKSIPVYSKDSLDIWISDSSIISKSQIFLSVIYSIFFIQCTNSRSAILTIHIFISNGDTFAIQNAGAVNAVFR